MFFVTELPEDIRAAKQNKDGQITGEVVVPKGTKISIQDTGEEAEILAPLEYAGFTFKSGIIRINEDLKQ